MTKSSTVTVRETPVQAVAVSGTAGRPCRIAPGADRQAHRARRRHRRGHGADPPVERARGHRQPLVDAHHLRALHQRGRRRRCTPTSCAFLEQSSLATPTGCTTIPQHSDCDRMNADSHLRAMLLGPQLTLQISGGEPVLGQWQRILVRSSTGRAPAAPRASDGSGVNGRMRERPPRDSATSPTSSRPEPAHASTTACGCSTCPDLLALGWLANREREKRHGGAHLLQLQHPARSHQRLRRELPVLLVRAAAARRSRLVHDVARAALGQAAAARRTSRSPRSTSSTACIPICRSTTTWTCCAGSSGSVRTST